MSVKHHNEIYSEDLIEASNFLVQYLKDSGFEGNLDDGTGLYDLLVKPMSLLYALFSKQLQTTKSYYSLKDALNNKELLGEEYHTAVDSILSNWFISRKDGLPSTGVIRLLFREELREFYVTPEITFTANGVTFKAINPKIYTRLDFKSYVELNRKIFYYLDIPVISTNNTSETIKNKTNFITTIGNLYFIRAEAFGDFEPGETFEQSETFIERARDAITTRECITYKAIRTLITQNFRDLQEIFIAGHGSPEMLRDVKNFSGVSVNVGNCADIYLYTPFKRTTLKVRPMVPGELDLSGHPIVHIFNMDIELGNNQFFPVIDFSIEEISTDLVWSSNANIRVQSSEFYVDKVVSIDCLICEELPYISSLIDTEDTRVSCFDPLVKSCYPVLINLDIRYSLKRDHVLTANQVLIEDRIKRCIAQYVHNLKHRERFSHSAMIAELHNDIPELFSISQPVSSNFGLVDPRNFSMTEEFNKFSVLPFNLTSYFNYGFLGLPASISDNTIRYYIDDSRITLSNV